MITINLLPKEMQIEEYTSPINLIVRSVSVLVAIIVFLSMVIFDVMIVQDARDELTKLTEIRTQLALAEKENADLQAIIKRFKVRDDTVETVKTLRVAFSKKLSQFANILGAGNYPIWLNSLTIGPDKKIQPQDPKKNQTVLASLKWNMDCVAASPKLESTTNFYEEIKHDRTFFWDFSGITLINSFNKIDFGVKYTPSFGWSFALDMNMEVKPPEKAKDPSFAVTDFKAPQTFLIRLRDGNDAFTQYIRGNLSNEFLQSIKEYSSEQTPAPSILTALVGEFNKLIKKELYEKQRMSTLKIRSEIHNLFRQGLQGDDLRRANRVLLEEAYPNDIAKK